MPVLTYTVADFIPFTKIISADMNSRFNDIKTLLNTTQLDSDNIQDGGIVRATKLAAGTANYVIINNGSGAMSEEAQLATTRGGLGFSPTISVANAGKAVRVNDAGSALELGTPSVDRLTESLASDVSDIIAGETIAIRDAVCLDISKDASNNDIYKVFKCDSDLAARRSNFIGFATAAAAVTAHTSTWTGDADYVTSNVITFKVNLRNYSVNFTTDNDTTLAAIATAIATDPDVQSAAVVDAGANDRVINVTGRGSRYVNITSPVVTGGASQPGIVIATVAAPTGDAVNIRVFGPMSGFSGLSTGYRYFLSGTAGNITNTPSDTQSILVGQALSTSVIFVNKTPANYQFTTPQIFVKSHGSPAGTTVSAADGVVEHFNFTSWTSGTSDSNNAARMQVGDSTYNNQLIAIDGINTSSTVTSLTQVYNKSSWSAAGSTRANAKTQSGVAQLGTNLVTGKGSTSATESAGTNHNDIFNGSAWSTGTTYSASYTAPGGFVYSAVLSIVGGINTANAVQTAHETWDGASIGSSTALPAASHSSGSGSAVSSTAFTLHGTASSYKWSGSWSSALSVPHTFCYTGGQEGVGTMCGFSAGAGRSYITGGTSAATTSIATTANFNGSSWSADTASSNARCSGTGAVI